MRERSCGDRGEGGGGSGGGGGGGGREGGGRDAGGRCHDNDRSHPPSPRRCRRRRYRTNDSALPPLSLRRCRLPPCPDCAVVGAVPTSPLPRWYRCRGRAAVAPEAMVHLPRRCGLCGHGVGTAVTTTKPLLQYRRHRCDGTAGAAPAVRSPAHSSSPRPCRCRRRPRCSSSTAAVTTTTPPQQWRRSWVGKALIAGVTLPRRHHRSYGIAISGKVPPSSRDRRRAVAFAAAASWHRQHCLGTRRHRQRHRCSGTAVAIVAVAITALSRLHPVFRRDVTVEVPPP